MRKLIFILMICKIGFVTVEAVGAYKLMENGFREEDLGLTVIINFPFSLIFGYYAAKWSRGDDKLRPWMNAYWARLIFVSL